MPRKPNGKKIAMARVDDVTVRWQVDSRQLDNAQAQLQRTTKDVRKAEDAVEDLNRDINKTGNDFQTQGKKVSQTAGKLEQQFTDLAKRIGAAFAIERIISFSAEAIKLAANTETVRRAFDNLNRPTLLNDLRAAVRGTVSDLTLMQNAVRAREFGIALEKLPTFFAFAKQQSDKLGVSVDYLVDSIINGIGRKSSLVLDNLGISATDLQAEFKRTGDFALAAANIIEQKMGDASETVDGTKNAIDRFNATLENTQIAIGTLLGRAGSDGLNELTAVLSDLQTIIGTMASTELPDWVKQVQSITGAVNTALNPFAAAVKLNVELLSLLAKGLRDRQTGATPAIKEFYAALEQANTEESFIALIALASDKINTLSAVVGENDGQVMAWKKALEFAQNALLEFQKQAEDTTETIDDQTAAFEGASGKIETYRDKMFRLNAELAKFNDLLWAQSTLMTRVNNDTDDLVKAFEKLRLASEKAFQGEPPPGESDFEKRIRKTLTSINYLQQGYDVLLQGIAVASQNASQRLADSIAGQQRQLDEQFQQGLISQERYEAERLQLERESDQARRQLQQQQARQEKQLSIATILLNTAESVVRALNTPPVPNVAAAATAGALGAAQLAIASAVQIPEFAEGVIGLQGPGTETSDSITAKLSRGESVMTAAETKAHRPVLEAIRNGSFDKEYISMKAIKGRAIEGDSIVLDTKEQNRLLRQIIASNEQSANKIVSGLKQPRKRPARKKYGV